MDGAMAAATLASSVSAVEKSPDDGAVLEKARSTAFHALAMLRAALRIARLRKSIAAEPTGPPWIDAARVAVEDAVMSKQLVSATALRFWLCKCLVACFSFPSVGHHLYGTVKALHQVALAKQSPALCRASVLAALGALAREHGGRLGSLALESLHVCAKQLTLRDLTLRRAAMEALRMVVEGAGGEGTLPDTATDAALKAITGSAKDKAPEVRASAAKALSSLARHAPGGVYSSSSSSAGSGCSSSSGSSSGNSGGGCGSGGLSSGSGGSGSGYDRPPAGSLPLEASLALCVKGLDDGSLAVKLAFAEAMAAVLSCGVEDSGLAAAAHAKFLSRVDKAEVGEDKRAKKQDQVGLPSLAKTSSALDKAFKTMTGRSVGGASASSLSASAASDGGASGGSAAESGGGNGGGGGSKKGSQGNQTDHASSEAAAATAAAAAAGSSRRLSAFTLQSAVGHLCALFARAATRSQRAGTAAAMVSLLKLQAQHFSGGQAGAHNAEGAAAAVVAGAGVDGGAGSGVGSVAESSSGWVVSSLLSLLGGASPKWGPSETASACAAVAFVLRAGVSAPAGEQQQTALLAELLKTTGYATPAAIAQQEAQQHAALLAVTNGSVGGGGCGDGGGGGGGGGGGPFELLSPAATTAAAASQPTVTTTVGERCNEWQLQVVLGECSHLVAALGASVEPLALALRAVCWRGLDHREYSVRYEASTTLAALVRALPPLAGPVLSQALHELNSHHNTLAALSTHAPAAAATAPPPPPAKGTAAGHANHKLAPSTTGASAPPPTLPPPRPPPNGSSSVASSNKSKNGSRGGDGGGGGRSQASSFPSSKAEGEWKKSHMYALHGRATVLSVTLQVVEGIGGGLSGGGSSGGSGGDYDNVIDNGGESDDFEEEDNSPASSFAGHVPQRLFTGGRSGGGLLWEGAVALLERQFDPALHCREGMGVLCTFVRAGWTLLAATLSLGKNFTTARLPFLLALWKRAVHAAGNQQASSSPQPQPSSLPNACFEPTHELVCLDAALGSLLGFVRAYPELFYRHPQALTHVTDILRVAFCAIRGDNASNGNGNGNGGKGSPSPNNSLWLDSSVQGSKQGRFRLKLVSAVLMEAFVWLPPGCFPDLVEPLCQMSCDIFRACAADAVKSSPNSSSSSSSSSSSLEAAAAFSGGLVESSLLETLVNPEDAPLGVTSACYSPSHGTLDAGGLDSVVALQAHLTGVPLESIERELAVYSPAWAHHSSSEHSSSSWSPRRRQGRPRRQQQRGHSQTSSSSSSLATRRMPQGMADSPAAAAAAAAAAVASAAEAAAAGAQTSNQQRDDNDDDDSGASNRIFCSYPAHPHPPPPTPLHGPSWRRPPNPSSRVDVRLLDASVLLCAASFASQDDTYQAAAIESFAELLNERSSSSSSSSTFSSVLASDEDRRRRERKARVAQHNVVTLLLAILKSVAPYAESRYNVDVPWVKSMHGALLTLLRSPSDGVRRAAGEGLALLATKMGTAYQAQLLQQLVDFLRGCNGGSGGGGGAAGGGAGGGGISGSTDGGSSSLSRSSSGGRLKSWTASSNSNSSGSSSGGAGVGEGGGSGGVVVGGGGGLSAGLGGGVTGNLSGAETDLLCTGAVFALACLKRLSPAIETGGFWRELEALLGVGANHSSGQNQAHNPLAPQPLRTWALHSLALVARTSTKNLNHVTHQARVRAMLQSMTALLEAHFLGAWGGANGGMGGASSSMPASSSSSSSSSLVGSGGGAFGSAGQQNLAALHEPSMLVCLARITSAMVPMLQSLTQPSQALVSRFEAVCFGVVDILPWVHGPWDNGDASAADGFFASASNSNAIPGGSAGGEGGSLSVLGSGLPPSCVGCDDRLLHEVMHTAHLLALQTAPSDNTNTQEHASSSNPTQPPLPLPPVPDAAATSGSSDNAGLSSGSGSGYSVAEMFDYPSATLCLCLAALSSPSDTSPALLTSAALVLEERVEADPGLVARCRVETPLVLGLQALHGRATCPRASLVRGLFVARRVEDHFAKQRNLAGLYHRVLETACLVDSGRLHLPRRATHWLLLSRSIILGSGAVGGDEVVGGGDGGDAAGVADGNDEEGGGGGLAVESVTGQRDDSDDDEDGGGGGAEGGGANKGGLAAGGTLVDYRSVSAVTRRVAAARASGEGSSSGGLRWQVRLAAVNCAIDVLELVTAGATTTTTTTTAAAAATNSSSVASLAVRTHFDVRLARKVATGAVASHRIQRAQNTAASSQGGGEESFTPNFGETAAAFPPPALPPSQFFSSPPPFPVPPTTTAATASFLSTPSSSPTPPPTVLESVAMDDAAAYHALPDFAALHLDCLVSAACSAATYTVGDEHKLTPLQVAGLELLHHLVARFADHHDPDSVLDGSSSEGGHYSPGGGDEETDDDDDDDDGGDDEGNVDDYAHGGAVQEELGHGGAPFESVLRQFTSQITAAFRPALAPSKQRCPELLAAGAAVFVLATEKGLITDPGRLKRLLKSLLPEHLPTTPGPQTPSPSAAAAAASSALFPFRPVVPCLLAPQQQQVSSPPHVLLSDHLLRLLALADLLLLTALGKGAYPAEPGAVSAVATTTATGTALPLLVGKASSPSGVAHHQRFRSANRALLPPSVAATIRQSLAVGEVGEQLSAGWAAVVSDGVRLLQGTAVAAVGHGEETRPNAVCWPVAARRPIEEEKEGGVPPSLPPKRDGGAGRPGVGVQLSHGLVYGRAKDCLLLLKHKDTGLPPSCAACPNRGLLTQRWPSAAAALATAADAHTSSAAALAAAAAAAAGPGGAAGSFGVRKRVAGGNHSSAEAAAPGGHQPPLVARAAARSVAAACAVQVVAAAAASAAAESPLSSSLSLAMSTSLSPSPFVVVGNMEAASRGLVSSGAAIAAMSPFELSLRALSKLLFSTSTTTSDKGQAQLLRGNRRNDDNNGGEADDVRSPLLLSASALPPLLRAVLSHALAVATTSGGGDDEGGAAGKEAEEEGEEEEEGGLEGQVWSRERERVSVLVGGRGQEGMRFIRGLVGTEAGRAWVEAATSVTIGGGLEECLPRKPDLDDGGGDADNGDHGDGFDGKEEEEDWGSDDDFASAEATSTFVDAGGGDDDAAGNAPAAAAAAAAVTKEYVKVQEIEGVEMGAEKGEGKEEEEEEEEEGGDPESTRKEVNSSVGGEGNPAASNKLGVEEQAENAIYATDDERGTSTTTAVAVAEAAAITVSPSMAVADTSGVGGGSDAYHEELSGEELGVIDGDGDQGGDGGGGCDGGGSVDDNAEEVLVTAAVIQEKEGGGKEGEENADGDQEKKERGGTQQETAKKEAEKATGEGYQGVEGGGTSSGNEDGGSEFGDIQDTPVLVGVATETAAAAAQEGGDEHKTHSDSSNCDGGRDKGQSKNGAGAAGESVAGGFAANGSGGGDVNVLGVEKEEENEEGGDGAPPRDVETAVQDVWPLLVSSCVVPVNTLTAPTSSSSSSSSSAPEDAVTLPRSVLAALGVLTKEATEEAELNEVASHAATDTATSSSRRRRRSCSGGSDMGGFVDFPKEAHSEALAAAWQNLELLCSACPPCHRTHTLPSLLRTTLCSFFAVSLPPSPPPLPPVTSKQLLGRRQPEGSRPWRGDLLRAARAAGLPCLTAALREATAHLPLPHARACVARAALASARAATHAASAVNQVAASLAAADDTGGDDDTAANKAAAAVGASAVVGGAFACFGTSPGKRTSDPPNSRRRRSLSRRLKQLLRSHKLMLDAWCTCVLSGLHLAPDAAGVCAVGLDAVVAMLTLERAAVVAPREQPPSAAAAGVATIEAEARTATTRLPLAARLAALQTIRQVVQAALRHHAQQPWHPKTQALATAQAPAVVAVPAHVLCGRVSSVCLAVLLDGAGQDAEDPLSAEAIKVLLLHFSGALSSAQRHGCGPTQAPGKSSDQFLLGSSAAPLLGLLLPVWLACLGKGASGAVLKPLIMRSIVHAAQHAPQMFRSGLVALAPAQQDALRGAMQAHMAGENGGSGGGRSNGGERAFGSAPPSLKKIDMSKYSKT